MSFVAKQPRSIKNPATTYLASPNIKRIRIRNGVLEYTKDGKLWLRQGSTANVEADNGSN